MASCFVISPIGKEGSEVREHADDVWKFIIEPALQENGINGYRADHVMEAGRITEQLYASILSEDFCIAILTFHNPNVFYEVAIAQSAGKPVIMLLQKGSVLPFDVHNVRVIEYDLRPTPIVEKVYVRQLQRMIQGIQQAGWRTDVPFGVGLTPLGGGAQEAIVSAPAEKYFRTDDWLALIRKAQSSFDIAAYGLTGWPALPQIRETLEEAAKRGCRIRILTYGLNNPAFPHVFKLDNMATDITAMGMRFEAVRKFFREVLAGHEKCEVRELVQGVTFQQIVFSDEEVIVLPYTYSANTGHGFIVRAKNTHPTYAAIRYEFDTLWLMNEPKATHN